MRITHIQDFLQAQEGLRRPLVLVSMTTTTTGDLQSSSYASLPSLLNIAMTRPRWLQVWSTDKQRHLNYRRRIGLSIQQGSCFKQEQ